MELSWKRIETKNLKLTDIPEFKQKWVTTVGKQSDWSRVNFALSFSGERFMGDVDLGHYIELTDKIREIYKISPDILKCFGTTGLRLLLYVEQRQAKWGEQTSVSPYVRAIVRAIRTRLAA